MYETIGEGRNVEEAIEAGIQQLSSTRDDVDFEILSLPQKSFFGLKSVPARVKVFLLNPPKEAKKEVELRPKKAEVKAENKKPQSPAKATVKKPVANKSSKERPTVDIPDSDKDRKIEIAKTYLTSVLDKMGLANVSMEIEKGDRSAIIRISGDGMGMVIGRRGENLDAIQYLTSIVSNKGDDKYYRITVDCQNYREKRIETLESLARKMAYKAIKTERGQRLEPMNPFERRVIHSAVSEIEGAASTSIGTEPNRRVVINSKNRSIRPPRAPRSDASRPVQRPAAPTKEIRREPAKPVVKPTTAPATPKKAPTEADDFSMYSKIELD